MALLMGIESAAVPLPSEIIMPFAGFLVYENRFTLFGVSMAGAIGSVFGSLAIYFIAARGGRPLVEKYGRYILIAPRDLELADNFFKRFGGWATFAGRMLPVVRTFISVPAGLARMPLLPFTVAAFVGSFIWSYFLAYIGFKLGEHWEKLHERGAIFDYLIAGLIVLAAVWWVRRHFKSRVDTPPTFK